MPRYWILAIIVPALVADDGWTAGRRRAPQAGVVLVTLDTTRADRLPPYGFMDVTMPGLDRLAREGVVFDQTSSVAPLTLPSHTSLFTGLFPPAHGVWGNIAPPLSPAKTTLTEILHGQGFRTAAFVGSAVLNPDRGLAQGFDEYGAMVSRSPERRAHDVMTDALKWLDAVHDSSFFLWTHLYDPHRPYDPPEPYRSRHADPYVGEILAADAQVARLLDRLHDRGLLDRTMVIVAGDHGESLGEHGERDHGIFLYESVLRVPLIIRTPGISPRRIGEVVRLVDLMPTVLDWLGLPLPRMDGVSLIGLMTDRQQHLNLDAYSESLYAKQAGCSPLHALRSGRFKLIDAPRPELYDLSVDPFESRNIFREVPGVAEAMTRRVRALARGPVPNSADIDMRGPVPAKLREELAALGYLGSPHVPTSASSGPLPDPVECLAPDGRVVSQKSRKLER